MADQKDDEKKEPMHQVPINKIKLMEVYRVLPKVHSVSTTSSEWRIIPGLQKQIKVIEDSVDIIVTAHGHAEGNDGSTRIALGIFVNGIICGIDGYNEDPSWGSSERNGMGLSYSPLTVPMIAIGSISLPKRNEDYIIDCRMRSGSNNGKAATVGGTGMLIQVFKPHENVKWIDIDLNDNKTYFNKDLEYKIEIKGVSTAFAMAIDKQNLWFFYADSNPGIKCIKYTNKRSYDDKYFITKIQCSLRK